MVLGEPVGGRESAARRWRIAGLATLVGGMCGGLLAAVAAVVDVPDALLALGLALLVAALIGAFVCTVGIGWTRDRPWHRSLWLAAKAAGSMVKDLP